MSTSPRALVLELMLRAEAAEQYANLALDTALSRERDMSAPDRALCTALFYTDSRGFGLEKIRNGVYLTA